MTSDATLATTHVLHWCVSAGLWANKAGLFTYMCQKKKRKKVRANARRPCMEPLFPTRRVPCGWETASRAGCGHVFGITLDTLWPQTDHSATNVLFGLSPYWYATVLQFKIDMLENWRPVWSRSSYILRLSTFCIVLTNHRRKALLWAIKERRGCL